MAIRDVDRQELDRLLQEGRTLVLDFYDEGCPPCKVLEPRLEEVAADFEEQVEVYRLDVTGSPEVPAEYGVMSIPTLLLFREGEQAGRLDGLIGKQDLRQAFSRLAGS